MAWVAGDRLQGGKYTIERELGRGRFGITYLVRNKNGDRQVIKTLNDVLVNSLTQQERERLKTMFLREAFKLQKCKHKYIVEVTDSFEEANRLCLVMEYVDGVGVGAVAVALAGDKLQESFSKFYTFLILASTSSLGLGLGWLGHKIFNTGS